ncbi:hypothetical protein FRX31_019870 [Thalictrum thalictroides]|uniref:Uncharacterized protein n=1 Tax=Thalictrum thalictroides TaxID=46969 RepID=A0A7J6W0D2_THATH|nr:hypothetical protein FRX31_019870 [Thalictrum thalictroides]
MVVEVDDLMPLATVPNFNVRSKKRSRSGAIKIGPEPQLLNVNYQGLRLINESGTDADLELKQESLADERAKRVEGHNAWKLHCEQLTAQLTAIGTPEEEEMQVGGEHDPSTPQDSTLGHLT